MLYTDDGTSRADVEHYAGMLVIAAIVALVVIRVMFEK